MSESPTSPSPHLLLQVFLLFFIKCHGPCWWKGARFSMGDSRVGFQLVLRVKRKSNQGSFKFPVSHLYTEKRVHHILTHPSTILYIWPFALLFSPNIHSFIFLCLTRVRLLWQQDSRLTKTHLQIFLLLADAEAFEGRLGDIIPPAWLVSFPALPQDLHAKKKAQDHCFICVLYHSNFPGGRWSVFSLTS